MNVIAHTGLFFAELPMQPVDLFHIGPFIVTNSMLVSWVAALIIIALAQYATRNVSLVPSREQNFAEVIIENLGNIFEPILGYEGMKKTFWLFASIFIFIISCNLFALFPGVGSIGRGEGANWYDLEVTQPFLRGVNADVNMTGAMALTFFFFWIMWSFQALGFKGFVHHLFGSKADLKGIAGVLIGLIFVFAGVIEVMSILFRPISLTFRLYGNIYGGEYMLESMYQLAPKFAWLILIPFYFFELLVAGVQALVFALLTAVFTGIMIKHDDSHGHGTEH